MPTDLVWLPEKRHRGWPEPVESLGLTPMYGPDGWCHSCGVPRGPRQGPLVLNRKGMQVEGVWRPNWLFDVLCAERSVAESLAADFGVEIRDVEIRGRDVTPAAQLDVPTSGSWYDAGDLERAAVRLHGTAGATCPECGVWKWLPVPIEQRPPLRTPPSSPAAVAASAEWFGDGRGAARHQVFRRDLAERIVAASPKDFKIVEVR